MTKHKAILVLASALTALIVGVFSNILAEYIAPAFEGRQWVVWAVVLITFTLSVIFSFSLSERLGLTSHQDADSTISIRESILHRTKIAGRDIIESGGNQQHRTEKE